MFPLLHSAFTGLLGRRRGCSSKSEQSSSSRFLPFFAGDAERGSGPSGIPAARCGGGGVTERCSCVNIENSSGRKAGSAGMASSLASSLPVWPFGSLRGEEACLVGGGRAGAAGAAVAHIGALRATVRALAPAPRRLVDPPDPMQHYSVLYEKGNARNWQHGSSRPGERSRCG